MKTAMKLAAAAALALTAGASQAYSNIYFFGDSLSDVGAFGGQLYPVGGTVITLPANARWTMGYGNNWTDVLAGHYGFKSVANNPLNTTTSSTGNNYAQGGAQAQSGVKAETVGPGGLTIQELSDQVTHYLQQTGGKADPNAVYTVWIGGNDVDAAIGTGSTTQAATVITNAATQTVTYVAALQKAGAKIIVVPNLPDISTTPSSIYGAIKAFADGAGATATQRNNAIGAAWAVLSSVSSSSANRDALIQQALVAANNQLGGSAAGLSSLKSTYNTVSSSLAQLSSNYNLLVDTDINATNPHGVVRANMALLIQEISANPGKYGFTNVAGSACLDALVCSSATYAQSYIFTDGLHPTPAAHQIVGDYVYSLLQAPYFAGAVAESGMANARQLGQTLDGRYQALRAKKRDVGSVSAFVDGAFSSDKSGNDSYSAKPKGQLYTVGLDFQATEKASFGFAMSHQLGKTDIASTGAGGSVDDRTTLVTLLASYNGGNWWLDSDLHIGSGELDTTRNVTLGSTSLAVGGNASQRQFGIRAQGGYQFPLGNFRTGPIAGLEHESIKLSNFTDGGVTSNGLHYSDQNFSSTIGRVGWQLDTTIGEYSPYAKVAYAHQFDQSDRTITTGLSTTAGDWTVNLGKPASNWMEWTMGVNANFGKNLSAWAQLTATSGNKGGNQTSGNVGLALAF